MVTPKKHVVPPNSKVFLPIEVVEPDRGVSSYVIEPQGDLKGMLASVSVSEEIGYIHVINDSNNFVSIKAGTEIGTAVQLDTIITTEVENRELPQPPEPLGLSDCDDSNGIGNGAPAAYKLTRALSTVSVLTRM